jgi:tetratricopeptide (TPR) repeat protein
MTSRRQTTFVASGLLLLFLIGSVVTLVRVDRLRTGASLQEVLYISSPKLVKRLSLGYEGLLADIYWTRAVQYFGNKHHVLARNYRLLAPLLEITTYLDPHLVMAYEFGANFLSPHPPDGAGEPERAIRLVENGIRSNPDEWRLYYNLGFIYYLELHDYPHAAEAFARGAERPGAHPFLKILAAKMAQNAGEIETARLLWITTFESTTDKQIKLNAAAHLRALQSDQNVIALEKLVQLYRERTGRVPASLVDLVYANLLRDIPVDPSGRAYKMTSDGRIEVRNPDDIPFITQGLPPGYKPPVAPDLASQKDLLR